MDNVYSPTKEEYEAYVDDMANMPADDPSDETLDDMEREHNAHEEERLGRIDDVNHILYGSMETQREVYEADSSLPGPLTDLLISGGYTEVGGAPWSAEEQQLVGIYTADFMEHHDFDSREMKLFYDDFKTATGLLNENRAEGHYIPLMDKASMDLYLGKGSAYYAYLAQLSDESQPDKYTALFDESTYEKKYLQAERFRHSRFALEGNAIPDSECFMNVTRSERQYACSQEDYDAFEHERYARIDLMQMVNHNADMDTVFEQLYKGEYECGVPDSGCIEYDVPVRYDLLSGRARERLAQLGYDDFVVKEQYMKVLDFAKESDDLSKVQEKSSEWAKSRVDQIASEAEYVGLLNDSSAEQESYYLDETNKLYSGMCAAQSMLDYHGAEGAEKYNHYLVDALNSEKLDDVTYKRMEAMYGRDRGNTQTEAGWDEPAKDLEDDFSGRVVDDSSIQLGGNGSADYDY